jgi:hypothetical protein
MIDAFESQRQTLSYFSTETECFRVAPKYRFDEPAHAGMLFYEKFDWGMTSDRFIELARQAMRALGIESPM